MYRHTITYRYAVTAGIYTTGIVILWLLALLDLLPYRELLAYTVMLPAELLLIPTLGMCGIVLFMLDLIFKKQLPPTRFNNKFLIATECILIAVYVFVSGCMIYSLILALIVTPHIIIIYLSAGAALAFIIRFITFHTLKILKK